MPIMNGFQFKEALNEIADYQNVPFLMISASPIDFKVEERVKLQIDEFIMKPFHDVDCSASMKLMIEFREICSQWNWSDPEFFYVYILFEIWSWICFPGVKKNGTKLTIGDARDVSEENDGVLVFTGGGDPKYVIWEDIEIIKFD